VELEEVALQLEQEQVVLVVEVMEPMVLTMLLLEQLTLVVEVVEVLFQFTNQEKLVVAELL
jgi:hypothetical protein